MSNAIRTISVAAAPIMRYSGAMQVSPSNTKGELRNLLYSEEGKTMANDAVDCIMSQWRQGDTQLLVESLEMLIENSSSVCGQRVQPKKGKEDLTSCLNYAEASRFASIYKTSSLTIWTRLAALTSLASVSVTLLTTLQTNSCTETLQSNSNAF
ncbi:hypothetical protein TRVL_08291 [Trypanosoma vivax]|nr:hypothetical protein TRVL_08291 [Trypanosoma vivax]